MNELEKISKDKELRRLAELREKGKRDEYSARQYAIKQGLKEGIKEGTQEGIKKGSKNREREIAKNMLSENMNIDIIARITGLTEKEIQRIKK